VRQPVPRPRRAHRAVDAGEGRGHPPGRAEGAARPRQLPLRSGDRRQSRLHLQEAGQRGGPEGGGGEDRDAGEGHSPAARARGQDREYTVITQGTGDKIGQALREKYGPDQIEVVRTDYVGPQVGKQLRVDGILAVLYAMGMILVYVGFRFDFRFSPGVIIALIHDAIITMGFFVVSRHEFNLTSVTVILTVVGYSVNDTIVVYDRIRENAKKHRGGRCARSST